MAPIRSIPILIGFQEGCSRLLGKSGGDDMFGILSYGRDELSPGRDELLLIRVLVRGSDENIAVGRHAFG